MTKLGSENYLVTYEILNKIDKVLTLRSSIWRKTNEGYQMIFHQGTKKS